MVSVLAMLLLVLACVLCVLAARPRSSPPRVEWHLGWLGLAAYFLSLLFVTAATHVPKGWQ
jgi:hypothetical protein